jgi:hypothetical protein
LIAVAVAAALAAGGCGDEEESASEPAVEADSATGAEAAGEDASAPGRTAGGSGGGTASDGNEAEPGLDDTGTGPSAGSAEGTGLPPAAREWAGQYRERIERIRELVERAPGDDRAEVLEWLRERLGENPDG